MSEIKLSEHIGPAFYELARDVFRHGHTHYDLAGGRGSLKSSTVSLLVPLLLIRRPDAHALVLRKVANTIRDSVYAQYLWAVGELGMPFFEDAIEELKDLDTAYSRLTDEIYDSRRLSLLDDRLTDQAGSPVNAPRRVRLPRFVKRVFGSGASDYYQEIDPALNTEARLKGVNALLNQIGYKCGFSNGYFVFNEKSGMVTATQVEADDRRTIQLVKDLRDKLESALDGLLYALNAFADGYGLAPAGAYEMTYDFGDVTYNREEDRARWWGYVTQGKAPAWLYFVKFEGMSEEEARAMTAEAAPKEKLLWGREE